MIELINRDGISILVHLIVNGVVQVAERQIEGAWSAALRRHRRFPEAQTSSQGGISVAIDQPHP